MTLQFMNSFHFFLHYTIDPSGPLFIVFLSKKILVTKEYPVYIQLSVVQSFLENTQPIGSSRPLTRWSSICQSTN